MPGPLAANHMAGGLCVVRADPVAVVHLEAVAQARIREAVAPAEDKRLPGGTR